MRFFIALSVFYRTEDHKKTSADVMYSQNTYFFSKKNNKKKP